ncbi:MAG: hypothetical protein ACO2PN_08385 [Pyrobaculum sp.]|jgi:hypothetical protein
MIICAPDMNVEIASRFGVEPCILVTPGMRVASRWSMKILADIGLSGAKHGVDVAMYVAYVRSVKPTWAVVPDRFADFRATLTQWFRYSPSISRYVAPIFVAQVFYRYRYLDVVIDLLRLGLIERVALPLRAHHDVTCSARPRLCAERAERALRILCGAARHIHLLGPALRTLRSLRYVLKQCERHDSVVSIDTSAYRMAANNELKRRLGGRWMPRDSKEAAVMLETWLRQALL